MKESILDRKYIMSKKKLFPKVQNGTVLYATDENNLYIDFNGERRLVHEYPEWIDLSNKICGVTWDYNNNSTKLTRTGDASDFADPSPATSVDEIGSSPFDNIYPWCEMREVNILPDGNDTIVEKDDSRFSYDIDTFVRIPEFYYKVEKDEEAHTHSWSVSGIQIDGYKKHPGSGVYVSKYHLTKYESTLRSVTGLNPYTTNDINELRGLSHGHWRMMDMHVWSALQMLYLVEFADWNSQEVLGMGPVDWGGQDAAQTATSPSGGTNNALYHTVKTSNSNNQYRYIEDINGNCNDLVDGIRLLESAEVLLCDNPLSYSDQNSYINTGIKIPYRSNTITEFAYDENYDYLFIPIRGYSNQSPSDPFDTYTTDAILLNRNDPTADGILVGGSSIEYKYDGMFFFGETSQAQSYLIGSRLIYDQDVMIEVGE